jgi:hypothetical protein
MLTGSRLDVQEPMLIEQPEALVNRSSAKLGLTGDRAHRRKRAAAVIRAVVGEGQENAFAIGSALHRMWKTARANQVSHNAAHSSSPVGLFKLSQVLSKLGVFFTSARQQAEHLLDELAPGVDVAALNAKLDHLLDYRRRCAHFAALSDSAARAASQSTMTGSGQATRPGERRTGSGSSPRRRRRHSVASDRPVAVCSWRGLM